jgi:hypothetical protein
MNHYQGKYYMTEVIEIPINLTYFQLPESVQARLQFLLDRQDAGEELTLAEKNEAEELWKSKEWDTKRVLRDMAFVLMQEPELRQKIEDRGVNLEEMIRLNSNLLPNADKAVVDIRKLRDYSLNPDHSTGKDKARLFSSILGMTAENAEELRQIILEKVKTQEVSLNRYDEYGQCYTLDFTLEWQNRSGIIRTGWIIEPGFDIPRLTSCYPLL